MKERLHKHMVTNMFKRISEKCKESLTCPYRKVIFKVRECLRRYPDFVNDSNAPDGNFIPKPTSVLTPPSSDIQRYDEKDNLVGEFPRLQSMSMITPTFKCRDI